MTWNQSSISLLIEPTQTLLLLARSHRFVLRCVIGDETLLEHRADSTIRSLPSTQPPTVGHTAQCLTPLELAVGDERMVGLLTDFCSTQDDVRTSAFDI